MAVLKAREQKLAKTLTALKTSEGEIKRGKQEMHESLSKQLNGIRAVMEVVLEGVELRRRRGEQTNRPRVGVDFSP